VWNKVQICFLPVEDLSVRKSAHKVLAVTGWRRLLLCFKIIISKCAVKSVNIPLLDRTANFIMRSCFCSGWRKTNGEVGCGWLWRQQAFCPLCAIRTKPSLQKYYHHLAVLHNFLPVDRDFVHWFFSMQTNWAVSAQRAWSWKQKGDLSFNLRFMVILCDKLPLRP
jgi:hypothetical protein